eukprot:5052822-Prymnesium_polylepis.1
MVHGPTNPVFLMPEYNCSGEASQRSATRRGTRTWHACGTRKSECVRKRVAKCRGGVARCRGGVAG